MRALLVSCITGLLLLASPAHAWEIKTTDAGLPIRWADGEIVVDLSMASESLGISRASGEGEARAALQSWQKAAGEHLRFAYAPAEAEALPTGRDGLNVIRWGTDAEDRFVDPDALATTYLTYRSSTGEILEADIVINAVHYSWSTEDCQERYDLQHILAHEGGHALGLAHSGEPESTMFASAGRCDTKKRKLSEDDELAANYLYDNLTLQVDAAADPLVACSSGGDAGLAFALLLLGVLWSLRRRSRVPALALLVGTLCTVPLAAEASMARALSPEALLDRADVVVQARVVGQEVRMEDGWPVTVSQLEVDRCDRSHCPTTVEVKQLGGEYGDIGLQVSGVRQLAVGQELVLFLREQGGAYQPVGKAQGVFRVTRPLRMVILVRDLGDVRPDGCATAPGGEARKTCSVHRTGAFEALSWPQFEQIFGANLLK